MAVRDTEWLTLEACREFQRGTCSRTDTECKYAHPSKSVLVDNGRVIACYDSLKGQCTRENCKYLHPPPHLKTQLEINGRNNLAAKKMLQNLQHQQLTMAQAAAQAGLPMQPAGTLIPATSLPSGVSYAPTMPSSQSNADVNALYSQYFYPFPMAVMNPSVSQSAIPQMYAPYMPALSPHYTAGGTTGVTAGSNSPHPAGLEIPLPTQMIPTAPSPVQIMAMKPKNDRLEGGINERSSLWRSYSGFQEQPYVLRDWKGPIITPEMVCREYQRGNCSRGEMECKFAHPDEHLTIDNTNNTVTVCMDYVKGRCTREKCKYFHPPAHLQVKIKTAQQQTPPPPPSIAAVLPTTPETNSLKRPRDPAEEFLIWNYKDMESTWMAAQNYKDYLEGTSPVGIVPPPPKRIPSISSIPNSAQMAHHHPQFLQQNLLSYQHPLNHMSHLQFAPQPQFMPSPFQFLPPGPVGLPFLTPHIPIPQHQTSETLPVCRDFKSGSCKRPSCKYAHVMEDYVEITDGKVTVCRYAVQNRCTRPRCKFYHPPNATTPVTAVVNSIPTLPTPGVTNA